MASDVPIAWRPIAGIVAIPLNRCVRANRFQAANRARSGLTRARQNPRNVLSHLRVRNFKVLNGPARLQCQNQPSWLLSASGPCF
jgi:hypothetical protein